MRIGEKLNIYNYFNKYEKVNNPKKVSVIIPNYNYQDYIIQ